MTIAELIEKLDELDPNLLVFVNGDLSYNLLDEDDISLEETDEGHEYLRIHVRDAIGKSPEEVFNERQ